MMKEGYNFIYETIQGGRKRPQKYRHFIRLSMILYDELVENGIIDIVNLCCDETAYFEYDEKNVTISFITYTHVEDVHVRILDYLVRKSNEGKNPIERGGHSRL